MNMWISLFLSIFFIAVLAGCSYCNKWFGLNDDNVAEEIIEDVIKGRTGADVDLTPDSPE